MKPTEFVRQSFRAYRNGPVRVGHSLIRHLLNSMLCKEQEIVLRSGVKMRLDMTKGNQNGIFWEDGDAEVPLYWAIRELLPPGGTFVDCGANCGLMGLLAHQYRLARVIFIEPHPRLAKSIETNLRLNGLNSCCELIQAAASDTETEVAFWENPENDGSHSIHADWGGEKRSLGKVRCVTLMKELETRGMPTLDFLKIDTEGNDFAVLKGLGPRLKPACTRVIYMEASRDRASIFEVMKSQGYVGFAARKARRREMGEWQRRYERGGRASFFKPLEPSQHTQGEVLWCGKDSAVASYLDALSATAI